MDTCLQYVRSDICRGKIIKDREKRELRRAGDWAIFVGREKI